MTTTSQPNALPTIALTCSGIDILSPPPDATDIIEAGQPVSFRINLAIAGFTSVVTMYTGEQVQVKHHLEQIETGVRKTLTSPLFTTPATVAGLASFSFTTGPFTSGVGGGHDFDVAVGDDDGVYRVITELHFVTGKANSVFDDRIVVVTLP